jgi:hypothetical protein
MAAGLIENTVQKLDARWLAETAAPAALFWMAGLTLVLWRKGIGVTVKWWIALPAAEQAGLVAMGVAIVLVSAIVADVFDLFVIRMLEGHWPMWLGRVRRWAVDRQIRKWKCMTTRFQELNQRIEQGLTAVEQMEYSSLLVNMHNLPAREKLIMPTSLGNVLRSAESRPKDKYGLDAIVCWPRLWMLLPETARQDLGDTRSLMDAAAIWFLWAVLFTVWTVVHPVAIVLAIAGAITSYLHLVRSASLYGTLLDAAFDVYRRLLYDAVCWPLPANAQEEPEIGARLTGYLWRGSHQAAIQFVKREEK